MVHLIRKIALNTASIDNGRIIPMATEKSPVPVKERRHAVFFDVISSSLSINTPEQFCAWAQGDLQYVFPHGMLICGIGLIENQGAQIQQLITCNFPQDYLQTLHETGGLSTSPVLIQWIKTRRPVLFEMSAHSCKSVWLDNVERHGLRNMAAHGQCDLNSRTTSYFSFSKIPGKLNSRHTAMLEMLVPHLHVALVRVFNGVKKESSKPKPMIAGLTEREYEVLQWIGSGKTNWEIAQVLRLSEHTVKNHVQRILIKLKVNTRAQAVVKGLLTI